MERIFIVHWNKTMGPEIAIQYPPEKAFPEKDLLLKLWTKHELNKENILIQLEENEKEYISIIQKVNGENYFLVLSYQNRGSIDNVIKEYPDILANIGKNLIELINTEKITRAISEAFNTIENYSRLDIEENLINFFRDKIKSTILKILRNGVISKAELKNKLKNYGFSRTNIDLLLMSFIRENLIIKRDLPGSKDCYFLINDLFFTRIPPQKLPDFSYMEEEYRAKTIKDYKEKLYNFFHHYECADDMEVENVKKFLLDKTIYNLLKKLRESPLTVRESINQLNNRDDLFSELIENNLIYENQGIVFLFTDIRFIRFFPKYLINKLISRYKKKEISIDEYLTHLKLLITRSKDIGELHYEII